MPYAHIRNLVSPFILLILVFSGCARSQPTRFYILNSTSESAQTLHHSRSSKQLVVVIGPIDFPTYLDRPQIVTRTNEYTLKLAEFDRWGEPLKDSFNRVLAESLTHLLATERVHIAPWRGEHIDFHITMELIRFDCSSEGNVSLIARWSIKDTEDNQLTPPRRSRISVSTDQTGFENIAIAMSEAVGTLSGELAEAINNHR